MYIYKLEKKTQQIKNRSRSAEYFEEMLSNFWVYCGASTTPTGPLT